MTPKDQNIIINIQTPFIPYMYITVLDRYLFLINYFIYPYIPGPCGTNLAKWNEIIPYQCGGVSGNAPSTRGDDLNIGLDYFAGVVIGIYSRRWNMKFQVIWKVCWRHWWWVCLVRISVLCIYKRVSLWFFREKQSQTSCFTDWVVCSIFIPVTVKL